MVRYITATREDKFTSMARHMSKWVEQVLGPSFNQYCPGETWSPAINIYEGRDKYYLIVDLAGVKPDDIDIRTEGNEIILSGLRDCPVPAGEAEKLKLHHMEIDHGRFCRAVALPEDVDISRIQPAVYSNGYLWLHLPRKGR